MGTEGFTAPSAEWRFYTVKKIDSISVILVDGSELFLIKKFWLHIA
jgi:hypothetical protein